jgi:urate oxidase
MTARLIENAYGKAEVRLVQVHRTANRHTLRDLTVETELQGDFVAAYRDGDNRQVLPTDTMKNTVYALAQQRGPEPIEAFAEALVERLLEAAPAATSASVTIQQHAWAPIETLDGKPHPRAYTRPETATRRTVVLGDRESVEIRAGIENLRVLKTSDSGFSNFLHDEFTTLEDAEDRILATDLSAEWVYGTIPADYDATFAAVRATLLDCFADHRSLSVQHTLQLLANAVFDAHPEVAGLHLSLPNIHHLRVDMERLGLENTNTIFVATEAPYGVIEGTFERA